MPFRQKYAIYSKNSKVELLTNTTIRDMKDGYKEKKGIIDLRFYDLKDTNKKPIFVRLTPTESYKLYKYCLKFIPLDRGFKKDIIIHKLDDDNGLRFSTIFVEKWVKGDKSGYAVIALRKADNQTTQINVSMSEDDFEFFAVALEEYARKQLMVSGYFKGEE